MPDWVDVLGVAMGSAWVSGINLYAAIAKWWVIGLASALYLIEFVADKVPAVDSAWDAVHTFIRAGAVLASAAFAHYDPAIRLAALLLGGGIA